jgi:hypothetical protein
MLTNAIRGCHGGYKEAMMRDLGFILMNFVKHKPPTHHSMSD